MMKKIKHQHLILTLFKSKFTYHQLQLNSFSAFHSHSHSQSHPQSQSTSQENPHDPIQPSTSTDQSHQHSIPSKPNQISNLNLRTQLKEFSNKNLHPLQTLIKTQLKFKKQQLSNEISSLPNKLSKLTGYGEIDELKSIVSKKEIDLKLSRKNANEMKRLYNRAAETRSESVREVNDLLARKASWSDDDLARFTTLVRTDHSNEQEELKAKTLLDEAEAKVDQEFTSLMQAILSRYHEEQVWSDKIRSLSTTFSLSITLINVLVFLAAIVLVEPYKRAKVIEGVENRMIARDEAKTDLMDEALKEVSKQLQETDFKLLSLLEKLEESDKKTDGRGERMNEILDEDFRLNFELIEPTFEEETIEIESLMDGHESLIPTNVKESNQYNTRSDEEDERGLKEEHPSDRFELKGWCYEKYDEIKSDPELIKQVEIGAGLSLGILLIGLIHMYSSK
ncbi:Mdm33 family-domain-containing protein [Melampsora americana]|nr:Mdm33 family-domain-containing protein [Melampsora americana]